MKRFGVFLLLAATACGVTEPVPSETFTARQTLVNAPVAVLPYAADCSALGERGCGGPCVHVAASPHAAGAWRCSKPCLTSAQCGEGWRCAPLKNGTLRLCMPGQAPLPSPTAALQPMQIQDGGQP